MKKMMVLSVLMMTAQVIGQMREIVFVNDSGYNLRLAIKEQGTEATVRSGNAYPFRSELKSDINFWTYGDYRSMIAQTYSLLKPIQDFLSKNPDCPRVRATITTTSMYTYAIAVDCLPASYQILPEGMDEDMLANNPTALIDGGTVMKTSDYLLIPLDDERWRFLLHYSPAEYRALSTRNVFDVANRFATTINRLMDIKSSGSGAVNEKLKNVMSRLQNAYVLKLYNLYQNAQLPRNKQEASALLGGLAMNVTVRDAGAAMDSILRELGVSTSGMGTNAYAPGITQEGIDRIEKLLRASTIFYR